jgi:N-acetylglucosamine-6-phosphate deacetylase
MASIQIRGAALVGQRILDDVLIGIDTEVGRITSVTPVRGSSASAVRARRIDGLLSAGFVDLHLHGAGGHDVLGTGGSEALLIASRGGRTVDRDVVAALRAVATTLSTHGYAAFLPTAVSLPIPSLRLWLRAVATARAEQSADRAAGRAKREAIILGAHSEGPALAHARKGAHDPTVLLTPGEVAAELEKNQQDWAALRVMTLAPELRGGDVLIDALIRRKVVASIGHTGATFEQATAAWDRGATSTTHLCNGMEPFHHRTPGVVGAALTHPKARVELIGDGVHVDARSAAVLAAQLGTRMMLISDALPPAGLGDRDFRLGSLPVRVRDGRATLVDGTLAGSVTLLDTSVATMVAAGLSLEAMLVAATKSPADLLRTPELGRIAVGAAARLITVDPHSGAFIGRVQL